MYAHNHPRRVSTWSHSGIRDDLAGGDLRGLAIAWRAANETLLFSEASQRPPMPEELEEDELNPQLHALIQLLEEIP